MKSTDRFKQTIEIYLNSHALNDETFAKKMENPDKNIDDCITYILNTVQKSGCNGFEDNEIYGMALHYYDEKKVKVGKSMSNANVVVNHHIELTEEEIKELKEQARKQVIEQEVTKMRSKTKKSQKSENNTPSLFDSL